VSISKFVITPFTFALINIPASAEIDMCNNTIKIQGHKIQFNIQGQIGCYRVTVSETVVMPPQSEIVVNGKANDRFPILFKVGLVETTEDFRKSDKALVGRTLVKTNKVPVGNPSWRFLYRPCILDFDFMLDDTGPTEVCIILSKNMCGLPKPQQGHY
jgi:hypothetical protein